MFALLHNGRIYDVRLTKSAQSAASQLRNERAFLGDAWGTPSYLIDVPYDCI